MKTDDVRRLIDNVVTEMKGRWDFYRHSAYLKKMGWTEEAYLKQTDPDYNGRADSIKDYYHGYKHIHAFTTTREPPFTKYPTWMDAYQDIRNWCQQHCQGKFRDDILRVHKQTAIDLNGDTEEIWFVNEIGGGDVLFFAFKDSKDYTMFCLRWA